MKFFSLKILSGISGHFQCRRASKFRQEKQLFRISEQFNDASCFAIIIAENFLFKTEELAKEYL
uniref:Uncharacterized protein n=1 Tax=Candidatus Berkiella cookevillensis TaxID=437022 RepID=A0A0Q9YD78_9GAMM